MNTIFNKFLQQIFQDNDGMFSSKRVIAFIATGVLVAAFVCNVALGITVVQFIFDGFLYLTLGALGISATELFANRKTTTVTKAEVAIKKTNVDVDAEPDTPPTAEE